VYRTAITTALLAAACASEPSSEPSVEVETDEEPELAGGHDAPPRFALTVRAGDGSRLAQEQRALAHASSAAGVAVIDARRRLVLIAADGTRRVLAEEAGAPPARGARGELFYVRVQDFSADVRVLEPDGAERVIASGLASAGLLAPQTDGSVLFVGARNGGVAGLWRSSGGAAQCLTNCDLSTGQPWGDRYVPPPGDVEGLRVAGERVEWQGFDGKSHAITLGRKP
jgi:hypothetical protein